MNDIQTLLTLARTMRVAQNRYDASATHGRLKEKVAAEKAFDGEINKWPKAESKPIMDNVTKLF